mmetsp:Transcript_17566/g.20103  ORF Transcript_17566/g.20103 Transcript_17566/m.20103 type:complete len:84 (+) Transcript_17566:237-488(+)
MVPTDEDKQCMGQIHAAIIEEKIPNAHQRICCWHKVDRGYILKVKSKKKTDADVIFVDECKDWFYSFTTNRHCQKRNNAHPIF